MIVLIAKYHLKSVDDVPGVLASLTEMAAQVRAHEPACRFYQASVSTEHDGLVLLYEHYVDAGALAAHRETPHFKEIIEGRVVPLLESREREVYELAVS